MYLTTGINREMANFITEQVPASLAGLVEVLGGPGAAVKFLTHERGPNKGKLYNPQTPKEAKNAARVVERYVNYERFGKTPHNRQITPQDFNKLHNAATDTILSGVVEQILARGLHVRGRMKLWVSNRKNDPNSGTYVGERNVSGDLYGEALEDFVDAWLKAISGGKPDDMLDMFNKGLMDHREGYDFPGAEIDAGPDALDRDDFSISYAT